jgi:hypothetical protein
LDRHGFPSRLETSDHDRAPCSAEVKSSSVQVDCSLMQESISHRSGILDRAPARCYPRLAGLTRTARSLDPGAKYARRDSDPQPPAPHAGASAGLGYERMEPPPGADPGHPLYESGAAAVRGGKAGHPGLEPGNSGFRARRVCRIPPMAIGYGRSESNAQAARFELARSARLPPLPRAPPGDRTPFRWVRASCITIMLAARRTSPGN